MLTKVISFQQYKSLGIVQFAIPDQDSFDYISGTRAIKENMVEVKEVDASGSVNNLTVFNLSGKFVFFMDGDILSGAKQNRVLNTSVLLAPNTKTNIPVSCVEQGRWSKVSDHFKSSEFISPTKLRAEKSHMVSMNLNEEMGHVSDQGQVWGNVASYSASFQVRSATSSLSDVYNEKKDQFEDFVTNFKLDGEANGVSIFVNKTLLNLEIFNRKDIYAEYFPKLLRGTAMEAFRIKTKKDKITEAEAKYKMVTFLDKIEEIPMDVHKGVGVGSEKRFETKELTGFELEYNKNLIHLTALNLGKEN